jgi:uncharacterized protein with HEPN domain
MSRHEDSVTFRHMLDHTEEAVSLACKRSRADLEGDRVFFLALLKLVEIVGEAATRISSPAQAAHPEIPWSEIIGTRNRLIHGYDAVDHNILWEIVTADFPTLSKTLRAFVHDQPGAEGR